MPSVGFELKISAGERPQTYALDRAATGTGNLASTRVYFLNYSPYGPIAVGKRAIWRAPRTVAAHEAAL